MRLVEVDGAPAGAAEKATNVIEPLKLEFDPPFELLQPDSRSAPLLFSSPHSGRTYPDGFLSKSQLDAISIRRSEDGFVDELFLSAPIYGAPLLRALFPRAYLDPNREPFELDPSMFFDELPAHANTKSHRVSGGLGTIARIVGDGSEIYDGKLLYAEADHRIKTLYLPYHNCLRDQLERIRTQFGYAILIDCHSMPSVGGPLDRDMGANRPDIILGDRYGTACSPVLMRTAEAVLRRAGFTVARNSPYAGGYITESYGRPAYGTHALQIEVNRGLYMNEADVEKADCFDEIAKKMGEFIQALVEMDGRYFRSPF